MNASFPIHELKNPQHPTLESTPPFWQVSDAPERILIQGKTESLSLLDRLPWDGLAVVGTRNPQPRSRALVRKIIAELKGTPLILVSGFARGIDTEAHEAALTAEIPTIAILGTSLDLNYPSENLELRKRILEAGGLLITEFSEQTKVFPSHFTQRNRLIAGWTQATWIVEAALPSGALNTAKWARNQHRTCYATPCFPGDLAFAGNQDLIDRHEALPLFGTEGLGQSWSLLSTPYATRKKSESQGSQSHLALSYPPSSTPDSLSHSPDRALLIEKIQKLSSTHGGTSIQQILDWALLSGWSPQRFFWALREALETRKIRDENGILTAEH